MKIQETLDRLHRRVHGLFFPTAPRGLSVTDPVCGMEIDPAASAGSIKHEGKIFHFCSSHCHARFKKRPAEFMKVAAALALTILGSTSLAMAHGENKPGPHGGVIQMPGAFHTELKQDGDRKLAIYLLDMNWKNPVVDNSRVEVKLIRAGKPSNPPIACETKKTRFECLLPKGFRFSSGDQVQVSASRLGEPSVPVVYSYPFRPTKGTHVGHH